MVSTYDGLSFGTTLSPHVLTKMSKPGSYWVES